MPAMLSALTTMRYADPDTAHRYPLPVQGTVRWQQRCGTWRLTLPLPELCPGTVLVPSLASSSTTAAPGVTDPARDGVGRHQWTLTADGTRWSLQEVPGRAAAPAPGGGGGAVSTHVDCYHVHQRLTSPELHLTVDADRAPAQYLICVSGRPLTIVEPPVPSRRAALAHAPAPRSQMTAPETIAHRICSPTCVSMVLELWNRPHDWLTLAEECHDPVSGLYGVWPLALAAAARRGSLGAVETFSDWQQPLAVLELGIPLVTSIRFFSGELPGAPLAETGGHLVVVHAACPEKVLVCDPAGADGEVMREYPAAAFSRAWLRHRGAAYILPP